MKILSQGVVLLGFLVVVTLHLQPDKETNKPQDNHTIIEEIADGYQEATKRVVNEFRQWGDDFLQVHVRMILCKNSEPYRIPSRNPRNLTTSFFACCRF